MTRPNKRNYVNTDNSKVFITREDKHQEVTFDYSKLNKLHKDGWKIYLINDEGIFFFLNNCDDDGFDWNKINKDVIV